MNDIGPQLIAHHEQSVAMNANSAVAHEEAREWHESRAAQCENQIEATRRHRREMQEGVRVCKLIAAAVFVFAVPVWIDLVHKARTGRVTASDGIFGGLLTAIATGSGVALGWGLRETHPHLLRRRR